MFEDKCKELRDEVKEARDEIDRLNSVLADMAPRAEINAAKKVCAHARTHACVCIDTQKYGNDAPQRGLVSLSGLCIC